jgi:phosphoribosylformylglycinamidine synthase
MTTLSLPIAHGEGRVYADTDVLDALEEKHMLAVRYERGQVAIRENLPANPTGTLRNIAGLTNEDGRILGIMPHPERAVLFTQLPDWTRQKEIYIRQGKKLPQFGPGLPMFQNAVSYFT